MKLKGAVILAFIAVNSFGDCDCNYPIATETGTDITTESASLIVIENPVIISWTITNAVTVLWTTNILSALPTWQRRNVTDTWTSFKGCDPATFYTAVASNVDYFTVRILTHFPPIYSTNVSTGTNAPIPFPTLPTE